MSVVRPVALVLAFGLALGVTAGARAPQAAQPFRNPSLPLEQRVTDLISLLTLDEKIAWLGQVVPPNERLGIKTFTNWTEGLHGLGWVTGGSVTATQFPQSIGLASTWDPALLRRVGHVMGRETRIWNVRTGGTRVGLAIRTPMVDLGREPRWGRNEESLGEDPFLDGSLAVGLVRGLQGDHPRYVQVAATLKHFVANNNEQSRTSSNSVMDERDLREYYLVPFQRAIVEGKAQSFMVAYNLLNGFPCTAHPILRTIVFKEWGFDGMICTDAGGMPNLVRTQKVAASQAEAAAMAVKAGVNVFLDSHDAAVTEALDKQLLTEADINEAIAGNIRMRMRLGEFDPPAMVPFSTITGKEEPWFGPEHKAVALEAARESIVLLKNGGNVLPLDKAAVRSIAVIGALGNEVFLDWYAGIPPYMVTPLDGIRAMAGPAVRVRYLRDNLNNRAAANLAAESDAAIVFVGNNPTCGAGFGRGCLPSEGKEAVDRKEIDLPREQVDLVNSICKANPRTVVVLKASFPYAINAIQQNAPAILYMAHSSQEEGNALAGVLFGDYNPAGRLAQTWVRSLADLPDMMDYGIRKGRTYLYFKGEPLYPFGFGLSYTTFEYANLRASAWSVDGKGTISISVDVRNTGTRTGDEVVQLYVQYPGSSVERPVKQLRGFERVALRAGESRTVQIPLKGSDLAYWDVAAQRWVVEKGTVKILVGASSADIRLERIVDVKAD
jgi:beta-glucosidase